MSPRQSLRLLGKLAVALIAVIMAIVLWRIGRQFYACELHPLARLNQSVNDGDDLEVVESRIDEYLAVQRNPSLRFFRRDSMGNNDPADAEIALTIADWWFIQDLQLTIWIGDDDSVVGIQYSCGQF